MSLVAPDDLGGATSPCTTCTAPHAAYRNLMHVAILSDVRSKPFDV